MASGMDIKASANPTKAFFVKMITRDIDLEDCILDLIDNSVDGAWRNEGNRPKGLAEDTDLSKYSILINASPEYFSIKDDCGGLTLDNAADYAFSFGRKPTETPNDYSFGVYGIGMKRAIFKLGQDIRIRSTYSNGDQGRQTFAVPIMVNNWLQSDNPPWDFDIVEDEALDKDGVEIVVKDLTVSAKTSFGSPAFLQNLRRVIARDYTLHLKQGLNITVNDSAVTGWKIGLRRSDEFVPMRHRYVDELNGDKVTVEIIGGMASLPPKNIEPDEEIDGDKRFGWYVICNGRIVLGADKSEISGWGTEDWPQWHRQYAGFIGIIIFTSPNAAALPLTTTKRSVDKSSEIFRRARPRMRELSKQWIAYTNARKQALVEAKEKEDKAQTVSIYEVVAKEKVTVPALATCHAEPIANVHYQVPIAEIKKLAKKLGSINMPYREVGRKSFDYTYEELTGEE